jgi:hypothetical protein
MLQPLGSMWRFRNWRIASLLLSCSAAIVCGTRRRTDESVAQTLIWGIKLLNDALYELCERRGGSGRSRIVACEMRLKGGADCPRQLDVVLCTSHSIARSIVCF